MSFVYLRGGLPLAFQLGEVRLGDLAVLDRTQ
jgi:hypothetical protein